MENILGRVIFFLTVEAPLGIVCDLELDLAEIYAAASINRMFGVDAVFFGGSVYR